MAADLAQDTPRLYVLPAIPSCTWVGRAYVGGRRAWLVSRELKGEDWVQQQALIKTLLLIISKVASFFTCLSAPEMVRMGWVELLAPPSPLGSLKDMVLSGAAAPPRGGGGGIPASRPAVGVAGWALTPNATFFRPGDLVQLRVLPTGSIATRAPVVLVRVEPTWLDGWQSSPFVLHFAFRLRMPAVGVADSELPPEVVPAAGVVTVHMVDLDRSEVGELAAWDNPTVANRIALIHMSEVPAAVGPPGAAADAPLPLPRALQLVVRVAAPRAFNNLPYLASATPVYCNFDSGALRDDWDTLMDAIIMWRGAMASAADVGKAYPPVEVSAWGISSSSNLRGLRVTYGTVPQQVASIHGSASPAVLRVALGTKVTLQPGKNRVLGVGVCCGASGSAVSGLVFHVAIYTRFGTTYSNVSVAAGAGSTCSPADAATFAPAPPGHVLAAFRTASDDSTVYGVGLVWMREGSVPFPPGAPPPSPSPLLPAPPAAPQLLPPLTRVPPRNTPYLIP
ncbi:hypothetical protein HXX76_008413 [Chlamydomonas incerta]|uniref:Uncharacterized protein n=1 Tax=Chlamydomonas incerta TaxID=51695 RepID=A0A835W196_CHLIN|nr:hypothetical protein HXX76_008413 [Chlamydomonas incerta]|eukprot:KAG2433349.1 hypothetical protein HXX76_008413 [Chlamydomonas incerta]